MQGVGKSVRRGALAAAMMMGTVAAMAQPAPTPTAPAATPATWPVFSVPRNAPCSVEWDDLGTPPCNRAAFETRYVRMNTLAMIALTCRQRDEAWSRDLVAATVWLLSLPRPGTNDRAPDAAAEQRMARRLETARERARETMAQNERIVCDDVWESTRIAHGDQLVAALRADRVVAEACRAGMTRAPECDRLRTLPR